MSTPSAISQPDAVSPPEKQPSLLVIVYGNPAYGDDTIDCEITTLLQGLELPNVEVCTVEQLTPELSSKLAKVDYAIFVHACWIKTDLKITAIEACGLQSAGSSVPGSGSSWPPCSLLALTHSVYGHYPRSWWVKIASQNLVTGHHPSHQMIHDDVEQIKTLIHECIKSES